MRFCPYRRLAIYHVMIFLKFTTMKAYVSFCISERITTLLSPLYLTRKPSLTVKCMKVELFSL